MIERIDEHIEFHEAIDSHKSDVAFLNAVKAYILKIEKQNEVAKRVCEDLENDGIYGEYALGEDLWKEFRESFKDS